MKNLEARMNILERKVRNDNEKEKARQAEMELQGREAEERVRELTDRIQAVLTLANKCVELGINFPDSYETARLGYGKGYHSYNFQADGIHHHVGLMNVWNRTERAEYLGIKAGGYCGPWDFYTNGYRSFLKHESDGKIKQPEIGGLKAFLNEFPKFEEAFLKWIDSMGE